MDVTVAICTWNRFELLDKTLARFGELIVPDGVSWELIVVNNNSTDRTGEVIAKHVDLGKLPIVPVFEAKQGHSNARNAAIGNARGDLLLWTDDDVLIDPAWLKEYVQAARLNPDFAYFGGTIEPWFGADPPAWILRNLKRLEGAYAIRDLGPEVRPLAEGEQVYGANMGFRTEVLKANRFDPRLGLVGSNPTRGDETELTARIAAAGGRGLWVGPAKVKHYIPATRLTARYVRDYTRGAVWADIRRFGLPDEPVPKWFGVPRWVVAEALRTTIRRWISAPFRSQRWFDALLKSAKMSAMIVEYRAARKTGTR